MEKGSGLCAPQGTTTCYPGQHKDAAPDGSDAGDGGSDAEAGAAAPPSMLCHNGFCLTLPESIRKNLVLLLWPSNLPPMGSPVSVWADQSGQGNDARALYPTAPPHVIANGVQLDPNQLGSGLVVGNSPSLDFGSGDFAVVVVGGLASSTARVSLFRKSDGTRTDSRQISIDWVLSSATTGRPQGTVDDTQVLSGMDTVQPAVNAYTLWRAMDHLELRLNEAVLGKADLPSPGLSTSNSEDVYLGVTNYFGSPADTLETVIAIRGTVGSSDLGVLEVFLKEVFTTSL
jgi:hypothetical protein